MLFTCKNLMFSDFEWQKFFALQIGGGAPVIPFLYGPVLECLSRHMYGDNLTMKFPPDFHNYTGLNGVVNSFL